MPDSIFNYFNPPVRKPRNEPTDLSADPFEALEIAEKEKDVPMFKKLMEAVEPQIRQQIAAALKEGDFAAVEELSQKFLDLQTRLGKIEARKVLAIPYYEYYPSQEDREFLLNTELSERETQSLVSYTNKLCELYKQMRNSKRIPKAAVVQMGLEPHVREMQKALVYFQRNKKITRALAAELETHAEEFVRKIRSSPPKIQETILAETRVSWE